MWSKNTNGPTLRHFALGSTRPTVNPPRSCRRGVKNWGMACSSYPVFNSVNNPRAVRKREAASGSSSLIRNFSGPSIA